VALLLSGGLDSSIVRHLAKRYGNVRSYVVVGNEIGPGELENILVGGASDIEKWCNPDVVPLETALAWMQEPLDLGSLLPQCSLAQSVRETVCLTGDGADEVFGGYGRSMRYDSQASDICDELVCWHLPRLDRVMMRAPTEVRSPFLARRVVEGALALPWEQRRNKKRLRDLFRGDITPGVVVDIPKRPLRTQRVEHEREANTLEMIRLFRKKRWPWEFGERG
jgi:asparagine synthetase B (glutamine-hydrolysing)